MAFRTSRTFTVRGRPPRLAGGISEPTSAHSASVKSLSYLRPRRSAAARCSGFHMRHLSPTQVPHKESQPIRPTQLLSGSALRHSSASSRRKDALRQGGTTSSGRTHTTPLRSAVESFLGNSGALLLQHPSGAELKKFS